ncbi:MAG TPA: HAD family hydrolase [Roseiflexaceae bacterium]|nr:HAD family hydrolase [Roseiflexaceae bacterium]HMP39860.1 HAD family hydrolase [Roseiflexaceae bacterium]
MIRAVLFDLDDTLYDLRAHWRWCLETALADVLAQQSQIDAAELIERALAGHVYIRQLSEFLRAEGIGTTAQITAAQRTYESIWFERMALPSDAAMLLTQLQPSYRLGLVTNGPIWTQREKIERFALGRWMEALVISEEVGVAKPDPAIFAIALQQLGIPAANALYVGDSPEFDLIGAERAGMRSIWMNRHRRVPSRRAPTPTATIRSLAELPGVLELIDQQPGDSL